MTPQEEQTELQKMEIGGDQNVYVKLGKTYALTEILNIIDDKTSKIEQMIHRDASQNNDVNTGRLSILHWIKHQILTRQNEA